MSRRRNKQDRGIETQWVFVLIGTLLAVFAGLAISAAYELLRLIFSPWYILALFGIPAAIFADVITLIMFNLDEVRNDPDDSYRGLLKFYYKHLIKRWKK